MTDWRQVACEAVGDDNRGSQQRVAELEGVLQFLAPRKLKRIVEIGVHDGGTLWALGQLLRPGGKAIGVDLTLDLVRPENIDATRVSLIAGNSTDPELVAEVGKEFSPIDFLFIDGDHTRQGVHADYQTWLPLMSRDGVIGFHDIQVSAAGGWQDVLGRQVDTLSIEFVRRDDSIARMGIGLLVLGTDRGSDA